MRMSKKSSLSLEKKEVACRGQQNLHLICKLGKNTTQGRIRRYDCRLIISVDAYYAMRGTTRLFAILVPLQYELLVGYASHIQV